MTITQSRSCVLHIPHSTIDPVSRSFYNPLHSDTMTDYVLHKSEAIVSNTLLSLDPKNLELHLSRGKFPHMDIYYLLCLFPLRDGLFSGVLLASNSKYEYLHNSQIVGPIITLMRDILENDEVIIQELGTNQKSRQNNIGYFETTT